MSDLATNLAVKIVQNDPKYQPMIKHTFLNEMVQNKIFLLEKELEIAREKNTSRDMTGFNIHDT